MNPERFSGCFTALATPFTKSGVDMDALDGLIRFQLENGIHGLVPCGSTGEAATMSENERLQVISATVKAVDGKVPVLAGTSSNNTAECARFSQLAQNEGADAVLTVVPWYNKPTQPGIYHHFKTVAASVDVPIILYDVPGRTGMGFAPETILRLAEIENIIGIKDATGNLNNTVEVLRHSPDFIVLSGDDCMFIPFLSVGAKGLISVVTNIIPDKMVSMFELWTEGKSKEALDLFYKLWPVFNAMFLESNPIPVKAALGLLGKCDPKPRLPLTSMSEDALKTMEAVLQDAGVI